MYITIECVMDVFTEARVCVLRCTIVAKVSSVEKEHVNSSRLGLLLMSQCPAPWYALPPLVV